MVTDVLRLIGRLAIVAAVAILAITAFWIVLIGAGVLLLGAYLYGKITGKTLFRRTSYGNVRVIHIYPHSRAQSDARPQTPFAERPLNKPHRPDLIADAVDVIDAETDGQR